MTHDSPPTLICGQVSGRWFIPVVAGYGCEKREMPVVDPEIEVVVSVDPSSGRPAITFLSPLCGGDTASELWVEAGGGHFILYQLDEYYDDGLRQRREQGNMLSPVSAGRRLLLVGSVFGVASFAAANTQVIARTLLSHGKRDVSS